MLTLSLFVRLEAKPGKEDALAAFLRTRLAARQSRGDDAALVRAAARSLLRLPSSTRFETKPAGSAHLNGAYCEGTDGTGARTCSRRRLSNPAHGGPGAKLPE